MSKYSEKPLSFEKLSTVPIADRGGMVRVEHFGHPVTPGATVGALIDSLPDILAAKSLRETIAALVEAKRRGRTILWGMGGHVIKCGLADILLDLQAQGWVRGWVMNGASSIHDYEIAIAGHTSEDVEDVLPDGRFGSADETGRWMNQAIIAGARDGLGMGEALGRSLEKHAKPELAPHSILYGAYQSSVPVTVHVAVGTDTPHTHPIAEGGAIGKATHQDFQLLCSLVRGLNDGGVYLNVGSAVVLPEVFLKAVSVVRNLGYPLADFTTINFDMLQHYRPNVNVVKRPHAKRGGKGYAITGHHEIMIPLLAAALKEADASHQAVEKLGEAD